MRLLKGPREGARAVIVTHLEMLDPAALNPTPPLPRVRLERVEQDKSERSRWFYENVGAHWHWVDRQEWTGDQWASWTDRVEHQLFVMHNDGEPVGYAELEQQAHGDVEIAYLGLLPGCAGGGRGGWLLTQAIERAWEIPGTRRVWVHTCDLDSPAAVANYRSRGMCEFDRTIEWRINEPDSVTP